MWKGPWYVPELRVRSLRNNSLTGIIPSSVGNATKLLNFSLSGNRINGIIPTEIEYGLEGRVSSSGDVYSYGIMMIEVLTKRRPTDDEIFNENLGLRQWIRQSFPKTIMEVVDVNFIHEEEHFNSKSEICIGSMMELALDFTKEMPESRITMRDVVKRLDKIKNTFLGT